MVFMLDKSTSCMAALKFVKFLYILCICHVMQEWGRYLRSSNSPVQDIDCRKKILKYVRESSLIPMDDAFDNLEREFKNFLVQTDPSRQLINYYMSEWGRIDRTWCRHGRGDVLHMRSDRNNVLETLFRSVKREYLSGTRAKRRDRLIHVLLNEATPYHTKVLKSRLGSHENTQRGINQAKYNESVKELRQDGNWVVLSDIDNPYISAGEGRELRFFLQRRCGTLLLLRSFELHME
jgi:hypothetical protein